MQQEEEVVHPTELNITYNMRHLMDLNLLGTTEFAHITRLIINGIYPSLIDGPYGLHNRLQFPPQLTYLKYTNSLIANVPIGLPATLEELDISGNRISRLNRLPHNLRILNCSGNYLEDLTGIPDSVTEIYCDNNTLTRIKYNRLPPNLINFVCINCNIYELPEIPESVTMLVCMGNKNLSKLPKLPANLIYLIFSRCNLTMLPELPDTLTEIWCDKNQISELPELLPHGLIVLKCEFNSLTKLPETLPRDLIILMCGNNKLTYLPDLPPKLELLSCEANNLTWLPTLSSGLIKLDCKDNQLLVFSSAVPETLHWLDCSNNTNIAWLPPLSIDMYYLNLSSIQLSSWSVHDVIVTEEIMHNINKTHLLRMQKTVDSRLAVYKQELQERQMEITMNPDRIDRLIRNGELGELGTWYESLGL